MRNWGFSKVFMVCMSTLLWRPEVLGMTAQQAAQIQRRLEEVRAKVEQAKERAINNQVLFTSFTQTRLPTIAPATFTSAAPGCPKSDYIIFNGVCFKYFPEGKTYYEASRRCAADGGLLAVPKDSAINSFLYSLLNANSWIGIHDTLTEGQWVYVNGQVPGYTNWLRSEPNDYGGNEDCAVMYQYSRGQWNDVPCSPYKAAFFCQTDQGRLEEATTKVEQAKMTDLATIAPASFTTLEPGCPISDYVRFNGVCYKYFPEGKTYYEAMLGCAADGGLLAVPKDSAINSFLYSMLDANSWIGIHDTLTEGQWVYVNGQVPGYTNWLRSEPNDYGGNEDCAVMYQYYRGQWNDMPCSNSWAFFCQIDQDTPPETASACEDGTMRLSCTAGKTLLIHYANYGRAATTHGCSNGIAGCRAANSLSTVRSACQGRQTCSVTASNSVFGDPCPGAAKYLETTYRCIEG